MTERDRLRIAVQKSGRLSEPSIRLLEQCGLSFRQSRDKLFCYGETLPVDLLLVRDDDIPGMIADGVCDLGIVGRNVFEEQGGELAAVGRETVAAEVRALGFGGCRLSIAVPQDMAYAGPADLAGLRIATSYPRLLGAFLARHGVEARIVVLNGSVEIAPKLGTADLICDLVSTGGTLVANQLREVERVFETEAILASTTRPLTGERGELRDLLLRRLDGVLAVKDAKLVMLHAPRASVAAITALLPPTARPSVSPLEGGDDAVQLQALLVGAVTWQRLEELKQAGASSVLVLPVEKMLA
jgi:ATP phosphoribosyltransferase